MKIRRWLCDNTASLEGKTVAVTGSTGGLGKELCRFLASLQASLILLDRNLARSEAFRDELHRDFEGVTVRCIPLELESLSSVAAAVETLKTMRVDVLILNAGAYSIPRHPCQTGWDNIFQINFASPYYLICELLPTLREVGGRVVAVGSIAHTYSQTDPNDMDFSTRRQASLVYGNAKRYLMFSLFELLKDEPAVSLAITHPGITLTNITAHYPKPIFAVIKHPMKVLFMKPKMACLSILRGVFEPCGYHEWIGPRRFAVWGLPKKTQLRTCSAQESQRIGQTARNMYRHMQELEKERRLP